ncbi:uncharacterized protein OCT59_019783 [Rhizophagus irregularis]|uniref:Uncharacterized protein n=1 Tax=Rhizophagus irregularis (strain DAOM 197198w) TaxID=1432141 RepID=A0A015K878_RHIIW|nr:hypothetical protein RirG_223650 [Rhizophagus irregularis DAOM 197198w]UZO27593.1 hypothetical protein OCT59_019783 [Rhizophagus irregularis]
MEEDTINKKNIYNLNNLNNLTENNNNNNNNNKVSYNVSDLLKKISSLIDTCDYQLALQFSKKALSLENDNLKVLEILGMIEIELEMFDEAREHFSKAISINPNNGYSKYMYMGQLSCGLEAISYFQNGVNLMISEYDNSSKTITTTTTTTTTNSSLQDLQDDESNESNESNKQNQLNRKISNALCSMTEIYLTDCCFEVDAEQKCEEYLNKALELDLLNPEVYQLLASVRLSQQRNDDAKIALEKSLDLWINLDPGHSSIPSYESRISLVKLLIELSQYTKALNVLEILQKENDEVFDLWYLYGLCYFLMGQDSQNEQDRLTHWEDARDCLINYEKLHHKIGSDDEGILQHTQELLQTINAHVKPSLTSDAEEDDGDDDANEVYDDDDDDDADADEWEDFNANQNNHYNDDHQMEM